MNELTAATIARDVICIDGPEAAMYLHGQVSQDVEALAVGDSRLSLLLEPRGRLEAFFRISRIADERFVLDTDPGAGAVLRTSLERFKLRTKAEFSEPGWQMLAIRGPGADAASVEGAEFVVDSHWPGIDGVDAFGEAPVAPAAAKILDATSYELLRAQRGLPPMGSAVLEGDIPNDTDLLDVAVSFDKGCYRGQELVERIDARAGGRRLLRRLHSATPLVPGAELSSGGAGVGEVRAITAHDGGEAEQWGFALVSVDAADVTGPDGGPVELLPLFE